MVAADRRPTPERRRFVADASSGVHRYEPQASPVEAPANYPFPKDPERLLPWSHVVERLERAPNYWLATTRPDGRPRVTPVWGVWVHGALYFDGPPTTRWARNLAASPNVSVHLENADDVVILEGVVEDLLTDAEVGARVVEACSTKYGRLRPRPRACSGCILARPAPGAV